MLKKFIYVFILIMLISNVNGYYMGWDYGVNVTKYKNYLQKIPIKEFNNLTLIYFTKNRCTYSVIDRIDKNSYSEMCAKGFFKYWYAGRTEIWISVLEDNNIDEEWYIFYTIRHELGHLNQFRQKDWNMSQDGADEYSEELNGRIIN